MPNIAAAAADMAAWLAANTTTIARHETAGDCYRDIENTITDISRTINRPTPDIYCGACPSLTPEQTECGVALYAKRTTEHAATREVTCWKCHTTYPVDKLIQRRLADVAEWLYTQNEILDICDLIGEHIPTRTFRHWAANGQLHPRNQLGDTPRYWISDVRELFAREQTRDTHGKYSRC